MAYYRTTKISPNRNLQAYMIGVAIGDGNLSNPNKRATRLRITCDNVYPNLQKKIKNSLQLLFPDNRVSIIERKGCSDISVYSNHLEKLLGWRADSGPKHKQKIAIPKWVRNNQVYTTECLRGLIETDGSIYEDRGYLMATFTTIIAELGKDVQEMIKLVGFKSNLYKVRTPYNGYRYNVRISRNVSKFIQTIQINKS